MRSFGRVLVARLACCSPLVSPSRCSGHAAFPWTSLRSDGGDSCSTVEEDGKTRARDRFVLSAPVAGTLMRIDSQGRGGGVARGAAGVDRSHRAAAARRPLRGARRTERVGAAEAAMQRAGATCSAPGSRCRRSRSDLARTHTLAAEGIVAKTDLERAALAVEMRTKEVAAAEFEPHLAEHELETARATAAASARPAARVRRCRRAVGDPIARARPRAARAAGERGGGAGGRRAPRARRPDRPGSRGRSPH